MRIFKKKVYDNILNGKKRKKEIFTDKFMHT